MRLPNACRARPCDSRASVLPYAKKRREFQQPGRLEFCHGLLGVTPSAWVLAAATTNVEYTLTVTDTQTDEERVYGNPLGVQSPAITDTSAFATCP